VQEVVLFFGADFLRDGGERFVAGPYERFEAYLLGEVVEEVAHQRFSPVLPGKLAEDGVAELGGAAPKGEGVGHRFAQLVQQVVEQEGVAHLVLRDGGEGKVRFEDGTQPRPFGGTVADEEFIVGEGEEERS
jgi:hypothetical protein